MWRCDRIARYSDCDPRAGGHGQRNDPPNKDGELMTRARAIFNFWGFEGVEGCVALMVDEFPSGFCSHVQCGRDKYIEVS